MLVRTHRSLLLLLRNRGLALALRELQQLCSSVHQLLRLLPQLLIALLMKVRPKRLAARQHDRHNIWGLNVSDWISNRA
jgi:hypothetical protein